jgi:hypothetical protein
MDANKQVKVANDKASILSFWGGVKAITQDFNQVSTCFNKHQQIHVEI